MASVRTRVLLVLALVAFVSGLALLAAHMTLQPLLLVHELTYVIYGIGVAGLLGALGSLATPVGPERPIKTAMVTFALNGALLCGTYLSTTVMVALPPVGFAMDVGDTLPEFEVEPRAADGKALRLADLRGKPVVLVFHRGGWCPFCQAELSGLNERYDELSSRARVLAVSADVPGAVRAYAQARGLRMTLLHDEGARVARQYGLTYDSASHGTVPVPAAIVLDAEGRIVWFHVADDVRDRPDPEVLLAVLRRIS